MKDAFPALTFYRAHGGFSDPGRHGDAVTALPDDIGALANVVRGLLIHSGWLHLYDLTPDDVTMSRETLPIAQRLDAVLALQSDPLPRARPARRRAVGTCRDYALMLCAFLRQKAVPARVRCGYARYFKADHNEDHWVCQYWQDGRWALADAQLDDAHCAHLSIRFDPIDIPEDQFIFAGQAWQRCRAGDADAASYGHGTATGPWFMRVDLVRDLLSLGKREVSDWDTWREAAVESHAIDPAAGTWCDTVATVLADVDGSLATIRQLPAGWAPYLRPFWRS